ncbi:hypothetical protein E4T44_03753 [Aureobasidium sp. EXF-8845]|nr:hypothetical protein E4T44_03753 [Aureobasidium sp. EXF-8845]KAI4857264.1 hypothetical protein E4T45_01249 [Aureobasidium sp. EXF-8846]
MAHKQQSGDACGWNRTQALFALQEESLLFCRMPKENYSAHAAKCKADAAEAEAEKKNDGRVKGLNVFQTW